MKCSHHTETDAVAVCVQCGRGLCQGCTRVSSSGRTSCSPACENELLKAKEHTSRQRRLAVWAPKFVSAVVFGLAVAMIGISIAAATSKIWGASPEIAWLLTVFPLMFAA